MASPPSRVDRATQVNGLIDWLTKRTEPSPNSTLQPPGCSEYISSVWPNGWFGAWMMTCGWSWVSGPLWAPTRQPALLGSDRHLGFGGVHAQGTTPTQVLSLRVELCSPRKTVCERPSDTSAARVREFL